MTIVIVVILKIIKIAILILLFFMYCFSTAHVRNQRLRVSFQDS